MKRLQAFLLAVSMLLCMGITAAAEGEVSIIEDVQFVYDTGKDNKFEVYVYAIVENTGSAPVHIKGGELIIGDAGGNAFGDPVKLTGNDFSPGTIAPGECSYVCKTVNLKDVGSADEIACHSITVETDDRLKEIEYIETEAELLGEITGESNYTLNLRTTFISRSSEVKENARYVMIVRDSDGNLIYIATKDQGSVGLYPDSPVRFSFNSFSSGLIKVWYAQGVVPAEIVSVAFFGR